MYCWIWFFVVKKENQWEQIMEESDKEPQKESPPPSLMQKLNPFSDYNRNKKKWIPTHVWTMEK